MIFDYDNKNIDSILSYAEKLKNKTFRDIEKMYSESKIKHYINPYNICSETENYSIKESEVSYIKNPNAKGQLGGLLEQKYFGYKPNSSQEADFKEVGLELKQTCVDLTKKGEYRAGERLSITNISFKEPVNDNFYESHLWDKIKNILLIQYLRDKSIDRLDYKIKFVNLFTPPDKDLEIIIQDYKKINEKIKDGKAHELSESDTLYLGACTKGSKATENIPQFYGNHIPAKRRNFCFKQSYMNYVLQNYILNKGISSESIIKNKNILNKETFENHIINLLNKNINKTDKELCSIYGREYNNNKSQWIHLAYLMLGIKGNHAEEFEKAGIVVKAIRIEENESIKENISFPPFKFKELVSESWENSTLFKYFDTTRFLFVVYKATGNSYKFIGSKLWNMPYNDLNTIVKKGWENIRLSILKGIEFIPEKHGSNIRYLNSLPKISDNPIIHIRPHAAKSAFKFKDGTIIGNLSNADELPDGQFMTKQSFWINRSYLINIFSDLISKSK